MGLSRREVLRGGAATAAGAFIRPKSSLAEGNEVSNALCMAVDCSPSISTWERFLMLDALSQAFASNEIIDAIASTSKRSIAFCLYEFGTERHKQIPWVKIKFDDVSLLRSISEHIKKYEG